MSEEVKQFIDKMAQNDMVGAGDAFKDALRSKVGDALDVKRQDTASALFKAEPHSDPKPEISGTGTFTQDGQVEPTGAETHIKSLTSKKAHLKFLETSKAAIMMPINPP